MPAVKCVIETSDLIEVRPPFKLFWRAVDERRLPVTDAEFIVRCYDETGLVGEIQAVTHVGYGVYMCEVGGGMDCSLITIDATGKYCGSASLYVSRKLDEELTKVRKIQTNRWKIENNQLVIFDDDQTTPLLKFDLYDKEGNPSEVNVFERRPSE